MARSTSATASLPAVFIRLWTGKRKKAVSGCILQNIPFCGVISPAIFNPACVGQFCRYAGFLLLMLKVALMLFLVSYEYLPPDSLHAAHVAFVNSRRSEKNQKRIFASPLAVFCTIPHILCLRRLLLPQHTGCVSVKPPGKPRFRPHRRRATLPVTARYGKSRIRQQEVFGNCCAGI
jgi:hypothetical protein